LASFVTLTVTNEANFGGVGTGRRWAATCGRVNHDRTRTLLAPIAAAVLIFSLAACGSDDDGGTSDTVAAVTDDMADGEMAVEGGEATAGDVTVTGAFVRQPAEGQTASAAYGTVINDGETDITLVAASVPFDATVEIHETLMADDGAMSMQEVPEGFVVTAGGRFDLEPGGPHIMLLDIDPADIVGEIEVTMVFDDGTELAVMAPVRELVPMGDTDMGDDMTGTTDS